MEATDFAEQEENCCVETYTNCFAGSPNTVFRPCNDEEKRVISLSTVFLKQVISSGLLIVAAWYLYIERFQTTPPRFFSDAFSVEICQAAVLNGTSERSYVDGADAFCRLKITMTVLSLVLLVPYWLATQAQVAVIMVSAINPNVLVPISKNEYAAYEPAFNVLFSSNVVVRLFWGPISLVQFIITLVVTTLWDEKANLRTNVYFIVEVVTKFMLFVLPDFLLTCSLFPIAIFLMENSSSTDELFVNLVAVQVFAEIDDILVKLLVLPRETVGESLRVYSRPQKSAVKAKYQPLNEYILGLNRHNFGFKGANTDMKDAYEYSGFHFVSEA